MKAMDVNNLPVSPNPHGVETRKFHENEHVQAVQITLKPGEQLKKHITSVDVFFYVLEGTGIVEIGDEKKEIAKDMYVDSPAHIPHCWYNQSDRIVKILVVKTPCPVNKAKIL
ncbi:MAG TPA: cupin domain-containing protein [Bacteroidales bacterium]|nr:cupin domain-containing protein [Bacteroidales bacterium]